MDLHIKELPGFLKKLLKPTSHSKHPTNPGLDDLKEKLAWYLPYTYQLLKQVIKEQTKWFFEHHWKGFLAKVFFIIINIFNKINLTFL